MKIDPEFKDRIPRNEADIKQLEESIVNEGCVSPLSLWNGTLIDGHTRYDICKKHKIDYKTIDIEFASRADVLDWIDKQALTQGNHRNLTPEQSSLIRGRLYESRKMSRQEVTKVARDAKNLIRHSDAIENSRTRDEVAKETGVGRRTVDRDSQFTRAIAAVKKIEPDIEDRIMKGERVVKSDIIKAAKVVDADPEKAKAIIDREPASKTDFGALRREVDGIMRSTRMMEKRIINFRVKLAGMRKDYRESIGSAWCVSSIDDVVVEYDRLTTLFGKEEK